MAEIEIMKLSLKAQDDEGSWLDIVRGTNLRRTLIVCAIGPGQNTTEKSQPHSTVTDLLNAARPDL